MVLAARPPPATDTFDFHPVDAGGSGVGALRIGRPFPALAEFGNIDEAGRH